MWGIELGPPSGRAAKRLWESIERRQPGLFAQMVAVPLFHDHRILTQVAGHHMNVVKALPPLITPRPRSAASPARWKRCWPRPTSTCSVGTPRSAPVSAAVA